MITNKVWLASNGKFTQAASNFSVKQQLPVGIYNIHLTREGFHLEEYAKQFVFPYKLYDLEEDFVDHVIKTYESTEGNLGVLLTGVKGTGKTVTAKTLANKLNLPIIIVKSLDEHNQAMIEFLSSIENDCVFFLDEFEKNFNEKDSTILQLMDGVYNSSYRKVFLLTTNQTHNINENLLGRPSRIRYVKKFGNLSLNVVNQYLDDELVVKEAREEIIDFIDTLTISTIDILKALTNEVNIHGIEHFNKAKDFFNVAITKYVYYCPYTYVYRSRLALNGEKWSTKAYRESSDRFIEKQQKENNKENNLQKIPEVFTDIYSDVVESSIKFSNLKEGDFFDCCVVVKVDKENHVVVVQDDRDPEIYRYYRVRNPEEKPSLYRNNFIF